ncbi:MAG: 6-phosphofructokinase [Firmicutes bacterium]|nr:6-phosphofructokinase [Bacillota bacterium]
MKLEGNVVVAQGGGPTAVINQSVVGVVTEAKRYPLIEKVYGAIRGVSGIVNEEFIDLTQETTHNLEQVADMPSAALSSTRDKPDQQYCREIFNVLKAYNIRYFFYIGGNDSSDTLHLVKEHARQEDYEFRAVHIPKTIDNDLVLNDHTPGYGSAAKFVSQAFMGVNLDNRSLPGVYIGVVMGRHAGFLTAAAAAGRQYDDDGPHLVYLPERAFDVERYVSDVKAIHERFGRCVVAVSEGIQDGEGNPIMAKLVENIERDAHGNVQLSGTGALGDLLGDIVRDRLRIKRVRSDTFGYLQRSFFGCVSDVDRKEAREVGEKGVQFAIWEGRDGSVTIQRCGNYAVDYRLSALEEVAGKTRYMPDEFINRDGNDVTSAFIDYVRPLLGSGQPRSYRFRAPAVPRLSSK